MRATTSRGGVIEIVGSSTIANANDDATQSVQDRVKEFIVAMVEFIKRTAFICTASSAFELRQEVRDALDAHELTMESVSNNDATVGSRHGLLTMIW